MRRRTSTDREDGEGKAKEGEGWGGIEITCAVVLGSSALHHTGKIDRM